MMRNAAGIGHRSKRMTSVEDDFSTTFKVPREHLTLLDRLDWKESYIYKRVIVRGVDDSTTYNKQSFM